MLRITWAGLRTRARRMLATSLAVVLGVGFVAGTLIFSDAARAGYDDTFARAGRNVDVSVHRGPVGEGASPTDLTAEQIATVHSVSEVDEVSVRSVMPLALLGRSGRPLTNFGDPGVVVSVDGPERLRYFNVTGRVPAAPGESMVDVATAGRMKYALGETIAVLDNRGDRHEYRLVGLLDLGAAPRFADRTVVGLPATEIRKLTGRSGAEEIVATVRSGADPVAVAARVRSALADPAFVVRDGTELRTDLAEEASSVAAEFTLALLIFGVVALVVAAFVIYNTFAILLAQRVRETALLRCVGATRRQLFGSVVLESAAVGLLGGALGIGIGFAVAAGLGALLNGPLGAGIPLTGLRLTATPVVAGFAIGVLVTMVAALVPAARATRVSPLAALRDLPTAAIPSRRRRVLRLLGTLVLAAVAAAVTVSGVRSDDLDTGSLSIVAGGILAFFAVVAGLPLVIGGLIRIAGALPGRLFGMPARLATANARRNPGRTAVTTASLVIGVGLMALFSIVIASVQATAEQQLRDNYPLDYVVLPVQVGADQGIPAGFTAALGQRPEFDGVARIRTVPARIDGRPATVAAIDPKSLGTLLRFNVTGGSPDDLTTGTVIARDRRVGDRITVTPVRTGSSTVSLRTVGRAEFNLPGIPGVDALVSWDQLIALAGPGDDTMVLARVADGVAPAVSRQALDAVANAYPLVEVNSIADLTNSLEEAVSALLALFAALLGTAILISLFGIANTLSLSVVERTRESATVRALGLTRGQLRACLLFEALAMGLVGAAIGIALGLAYGRLLVGSLMRDIGPVTVIPWSWIAGLTVLAALAATVAAVLPARRAGRVSIVTSLAEA